MEISMAARCANSFRVAHVARRHSLLYPHWQQSCCLLVTSTPQPLQGRVCEPLQSLTRWTLQKSVRQLLPQSSVELTVSHLHVLCPLGMSLVVVYQQSPASLIDECLGWRGWGPSPGALALTMLAWGPQGLGPQEEAKHCCTPEEVVLTYIQNCLSTWERLDVHTELFVYAGALLGPQKIKSIRPPLLLKKWRQTGVFVTLWALLQFLWLFFSLSWFKKSSCLLLAEVCTQVWVNHLED